MNIQQTSATAMIAQCASTTDRTTITALVFDGNRGKFNASPSSNLMCAMNGRTFSF